MKFLCVSFEYSCLPTLGRESISITMLDVKAAPTKEISLILLETISRNCSNKYANARRDLSVNLRNFTVVTSTIGAV